MRYFLSLILILVPVYSYAGNVNTVPVQSVSVSNTPNVTISGTPNVSIASPTDDLGALETIEYAHHEIHEGNHYQICSYTTLSASGSVDFYVGVGAKAPHMTFDLQTTGATTMKIYRDVSVSGGVTVTPLNNNENSTNTSSLTIKSGGSAIGGSLISQTAWGVTSSPSARTTGSYKRENELILKTSTGYRFWIESDSADNIVSYCGEWYEE